MSYFLIAPGLELSIELSLSMLLEEAIALQWNRLEDEDAKRTFCRRLSFRLERVFQETIDWDIKEPTPAQVAYALGLAKQLGIPVPPEVLRFRKSMTEFLDLYAPQARERRSRLYSRPSQ